MLIRTYIIPLLALAGIVYAAYTVRTNNVPVVPAPPIAEPGTSPFARAVAGAGVIEASSQNIAIGAHTEGVVSTVLVRAGETVAGGDALFVIDDRAAKAELALREAELASAQRELEQLHRRPRAEDLPPAQARVASALVELADAQDQLERLEEAGARGAATTDELQKARFAVNAARQRLAVEEAELALLKAGAWQPDVALAEARVRTATASAAAARIEIERLTVRAPIAATVLQVNIRPGEFAATGKVDPPLMIIGDTRTMHIRVDIDENDAWRLRPQAGEGAGAAVAFLRGNKDFKVNLRFVRVEPLVVPKRSLTGESTERVDVRVLQAIFAFERDELARAYVGQQVDVYIEDWAGDRAVIHGPRTTAARD